MRWLRSTHGDTLVEVIFALVILSSILVTTLSIGRVGRVSGQNAQLRTQAINLVQEQYEALKSYRDTVPWDNFYGNCALAPCYGDGIRVAQNPVNPTCTNLQTPTAGECIIHMERDSRTTISGSPNANYGNWITCPGAWNPPLDSDSGVSGWRNRSYCSGPAPSASQQPNITVKIKLLTPACSPQPQNYAFQIIGEWKQGGVKSSDSTTLNTIIGNVKGGPGGC